MGPFNDTVIGLPDSSGENWVHLEPSVYFSYFFNVSVIRYRVQ